MSKRSRTDASDASVEDTQIDNQSIVRKLHNRRQALSRAVSVRPAKSVVADDLWAVAVLEGRGVDRNVGVSFQ